jgi:outer membrane protein insertion porin family
MVGEERGRNEIQVGGGYSGVDGVFFNGVYSTRNFLGRGQTVSLALQIGGRSSRYQLSFQEPWFLNRPYRAGFSLFNRRSDFGASLRSTSRGIGLIFGKRMGRYGNLNIGYNWQNVESESVLTTAGGTGATGVITTENTVSSVTPVFSFNKINNPYRPTRGQSLSISFQIAGGPLGGDTSFLKPIISYTGYRKLGGKAFFGMHAQGGWVRAWQDGDRVINTSNIEGVPRFERFWLGGEVLGPRVFETRSITPVRYVIIDARNAILDATSDPTGQPSNIFVAPGGVPVPIEIGGDRFFLFQTEMVYPVTQQAELALFLDVGDALFEDQSFGFDTTRVSAGFEVRFHLPIFPVPLRLIYGWPVRKMEQDRTSSFTFSIGKSF